MLSEATRKRIADLTSKYPQPRSALIPALQIIQMEAGYLSVDIFREVAQIFQLSPNEVYEVASFYSMLFKKPVGKYVIQVCTNISCLLRKLDQILDGLK
jgi:NADH-quinone oxidoreductase subunit E